MDKKKRLLEIMQMMQDLYPHLDRLMIEDIENPDSIIITSELRIEEVAAQHGYDTEIVEAFFDDLLEDEDPFGMKQTLIGFDDDDDNGGGFMQ